MTYFILGLTIIWRLILTLSAHFGGLLFPFQPSYPYADVYFTGSGLPFWIWSFAGFDGVHYLTIAKTGYSAQFTQVFFPIYPLTIGIISKIITSISPIVIGIVISNIFFLSSLYVFWKLLSLDYRSKQIRWMLLFMLAFPTSFFFGSIYAESLFLFLVLVSFYFSRKEKWFLSCLFASIASATKITGIFLLPALTWEMFKAKRKNNQRFCGGLWPLFFVPVGLILYMVYLQLRFGDFLYFWHAQPVFGAERSGSGIILFPQVLFRYLNMLRLFPANNYNYYVVLWEFVSVIVSFGLLLFGYMTKIRRSYLIFAFFCLLIPTLTGTFSSMPRYVLIAFPIYIALGQIRSNSVKMLILFVNIFLLILFTMFFTSGRWVA